MIQFDNFTSGGKTLCCEFRCQRCSHKETVPVKDCMPNDEGSRYLRNMNVPKGWSDHFYGWLLCPECTEKLKAFMKMEGDDHG